MTNSTGCGVHGASVEFCPSCKLVAELRDERDHAEKILHYLENREIAELREMYDQLLDANKQLNSTNQELIQAAEDEGRVIVQEATPNENTDPN